MTVYLVDKSAFEQHRYSEAAREVLTALAENGRLAVCEIVALQLRYSTRASADYGAGHRG